MNVKMKHLLLFSILFLNIYCSSALKCYVCTISASESSDTCIVDPAGVTQGSPTLECNGKYCTIVRQEYKDPAGRVVSFYRGCENNPIYLNTMIEDAEFKTYYRACTADLCNIGNGVQPVSNGNLGPGGAFKNLLVPGIGSGNSIIPSLKIIVTLTGILFAITTILYK